MEQKLYRNYLNEHKDIINTIYQIADETHKSVNQLYDGNKPYSHHLSMVADAVYMFGEYLFEEETIHEVIPVIFGAYFHDSIEDARLTYNDVKKIAMKIMNDEQQAVLAADIVYALTNEKGKTRAERANDKYYSGIRHTPYAPFVKMCDRYANIKYSYERMKKSSEKQSRMFRVYQKEWGNFVEKVFVYECGIEYEIPDSIINEIDYMFSEHFI